jgi:O-acetylhomoserine (thiol)-lyase
MATINGINTKEKNVKPFEKRDKKRSITLEKSIIEDRLAGLVGASEVLSVKRVESAIFLLVKNIAKKGQNIVTLNSVSLLKNEPIRERLGLEVRLAEDESLTGFKDLVDENTSLIFLESLGLYNHIIPDFQKIITFAHDRNIPVAIHNTVGAAGNIFNPIKWGADFSIEDLSFWNNSSQLINTVLAERKGTPYSIISKIKERNSNELTPLLLPENLIEKAKEIESVSSTIQKVSSASLITAKWLKEITHVKSIEFVGIANHKSHFNALKYFSSGYGNVISFSLWTNYRSFDFFLDNLIPRSFNLFKINEINYEQKKVTIKVLETDIEKITRHFQQAFELLQQHLGSDYFLYENLYDTQDVVGY